jgi:histidyl-tRNA synthetase
MAAKPSIPKGTRDFSPAEMAKRNYIFDTIREVYHLYGFRQIETPAMEMLTTLMGKYGEEGDKLLFKILNSGDFMSDYDEGQRNKIEAIILEKESFLNTYIRNKTEDEINTNLIDMANNPASSMKEDFVSIVTNRMQQDGTLVIENNKAILNIEEDSIKDYSQKIVNELIDELIKDKTIKPIVGMEKGLRYDLTVPFARYVVMHRDELTFPFKRYQIQPVWRADRPQKGRYREFYQCDADVVGSDSLLNEVELMQIVDEVFSRFDIRVCIKINNRKILTGIAEIIGEADKIVDITVAIDKLDKIGLENVNAELRDKGIGPEAIARLQPIILLQGSNAGKLQTLQTVLADSPTGLQGVSECSFILDTLAALGGLRNEVELDLTLARGLNYYTGAIFEVKALDVQIGSITGGGRYDNLTGVFGMAGVSGVGISFGADRIFDVLNQLQLYPKDAATGTRLLFINFGPREAAYSLALLARVRAAGIRAELYPDAAKMKKQMGYANSLNIPFVAMAGENEINDGRVTLKDMESGEQTTLTVEEMIQRL